MRIASIVHDIALALLTGGIATASVAAIILFDTAPSREVAGEIGQTIFEVVAMGVFVLALVLLAMRVVLSRAEAQWRGRPIAMALAALIVILSGVIALWVTPSLGEIWRDGRHAEDGSGLAGPDRDAFMSRHSIGSAAYLIILLAGAVLIGLRAPLRV